MGNNFVWIINFLILGLSLNVAHAETNIKNSVNEEDKHERLIWDYKPISIALTIGQERRLHFPAPVKVYIPGKIGGLLRSQSVDNVVYWKARGPFNETRITVQEIDTQQTYLLDIWADQTPQDVNVIHITSRVPQNKIIKNNHGRSVLNEKSTTIEPDEISMVRYASQTLYAPRRLISDINQRIPGIWRTMVPTKNYYKLYRGGAVTAKPIAGWKSNSLYVTAIRLTNTTEKEITLDPRKIRGQFKMSAFQHTKLKPKITPLNTTVLYLISVEPFKESAKYVQVIKQVKKKVPNNDKTEVAMSDDVFDFESEF